MADYTEMWRTLGLNLENHAGLLSVLSEGYKNIYLSQKGRPKGMEYFDFVIDPLGLRCLRRADNYQVTRCIEGFFDLHAKIR